MQKIFPLEGKVQHYAWGGFDFIPNLLGLESDAGPCAEYWLGAHVNAPALVHTEKGNEALDKFLEDNPKGYLGTEICNKFGRLPFLFKVLDVHNMLSIQVHPSKKEAEKGFKRENELSDETESGEESESSSSSSSSSSSNSEGSGSSNENEGDDNFNEEDEEETNDDI